MLAKNRSPYHMMYGAGPSKMSKTNKQPVTEQPVTEQPVTEQPVVEQPVVEQMLMVLTLEDFLELGTN